MGTTLKVSYMSCALVSLIFALLLSVDLAACHSCSFSTLIKTDTTRKSIDLTDDVRTPRSSKSDEISSTNVCEFRTSTPAPFEEDSNNEAQVSAIAEEEKLVFTLKRMKDIMVEGRLAGWKAE